METIDLKIERDIERDKINNCEKLQNMMKSNILLNAFYIFLNVVLPVLLALSIALSLMNLYYIFLTLLMVGMNSLNYFYGKTIQDSYNEIINCLQLYDALNIQIVSSQKEIKRIERKISFNNIKEANENIKMVKANSNEETEEEQNEEVVENEIVDPVLLALKNCAELCKVLDLEDRQLFIKEIEEIKNDYYTRNMELIKSRYQVEVTLTLETYKTLLQDMLQKITSLNTRIDNKVKEVQSRRDFENQIEYLNNYLQQNKKEEQLQLKR